MCVLSVSSSTHNYGWLLSHYEVLSGNFMGTEKVERSNKNDVVIILLRWPPFKGKLQIVHLMALNGVSIKNQSDRVKDNRKYTNTAHTLWTWQRPTEKWKIAIKLFASLPPWSYIVYGCYYANYYHRHIEWQTLTCISEPFVIPLNCHWKLYRRRFRVPVVKSCDWQRAKLPLRNFWRLLNADAASSSRSLQ